MLGKHPKRITCGAWSNGGRLAMGSEDRTLTISDKEGGTIDQRELKSVSLLFLLQRAVNITYEWD